jgi:hypothetical protein
MIGLCFGGLTDVLHQTVVVDKCWPANPKLLIASACSINGIHGRVFPGDGVSKWESSVAMLDRSRLPVYRIRETFVFALKKKKLENLFVFIDL